MTSRGRPVQRRKSLAIRSGLGAVMSVGKQVESSKAKNTDRDLQHQPVLSAEDGLLAAGIRYRTEPDQRKATSRSMCLDDLWSPPHNSFEPACRSTDRQIEACNTFAATSEFGAQTEEPPSPRIKS